MEGILVPAWALWVVGALFVGWASFITTLTFANREAIAVGKAHDENVAKEINKLSEEFRENNSEIKGMINGLGVRIDTLFGNEMAFLKNLKT